jgi:TM2 domain-containing membrane protein YozV
MDINPSHDFTFGQQHAPTPPPTPESTYGPWQPAPYWPPAPRQQHADPQAPYGRDPVTGGPLSDKQKIVAALLQFIFGWWGLGRWYLGDKKIAGIQLALGVTGLIGTAILVGAPLLLGAWAWGVIDAIMILTDKVTDSQGRKLR